MIVRNRTSSTATLVIAHHNLSSSTARSTNESMPHTRHARTCIAPHMDSLFFTIYATKAGARDFSLFFSEAIGTFFTRYEMMKGTRMFITEASRTGQWGLHEWRLFGGRAGQHCVLGSGTLFVLHNSKNHLSTSWTGTGGHEKPTSKTGITYGMLDRQCEKPVTWLLRGRQTESPGKSSEP